MSCSSAGSSRRSTRSSVAVPTIAPGVKNCIFCGKLERRIPNKNVLQKTSQMLTEAAEKKLREAASIRKDERVQIAIAGESSLIAREVFYHKLCYGDFTRKSSLDKIQAVAEDTSGTSTCTAPSSFLSQLFQFVRLKLFAEKEMLTVRQIMSQLEGFMAHGGAAPVNLRSYKVKEPCQGV